MIKLRKTIIVLYGFAVGFSLVIAAGFLFYKFHISAYRPNRYQPVIPVAGEAAQGSKVFAASSLDRIFKDGATLLKPSFDTKVHLFAAQNEYESFQMVVASGNNGLKQVALNVSDLIGPGGELFKKENITWYVVGYVPTERPYYPVKYIGDWPDPLLPAAKTDIASKNFQPFWVTFYVPKGTGAGLFQGTIRVEAGNSLLKEIPIKLQVYDFTLPVQNSLKTAFDFYGQLTRVRYPQKDKENDRAYEARIGSLKFQYLTEMLRYRINPILNIDPTNNEELSLVDRLCILGLNNFSIGKKGGTFENNWPGNSQDIENLFMLYRTYGEILKLNKLLPYTYIYTWDEGDIGNPTVAKLCSMIHRAYPGLKNMVCYHGIWVPQDLPDWGKDIDIWCFNIDNFDENKLRQLQKYGMEMWMYISGPSGYGSPNLAIDFDSIDYRIVPWLCWKYDLKGFLYWCVNFWPNVNPFESARNTQWEQNGNGLLFYPGETGPMGSLRLEIFRDGMEDYEYIQLLMQKLRIIKQKNLNGLYQKIFDESIRLLTVDPSLAESMFKFTKDNEVLMNRRNAIAQKIEEFNRLLPEFSGKERGGTP